MAIFLLVPGVDQQQSILIVSSAVPGGRGRHRRDLAPMSSIVIIEVRCLSPTVSAAANIQNMGGLVHNRVTIIILTAKLLLITAAGQFTPILSPFFPFALFGAVGFVLLLTAGGDGNLASVLMLLLMLMSGRDGGAFFRLGG